MQLFTVSHSALDLTLSLQHTSDLIISYTRSPFCLSVAFLLNYRWFFLMVVLRVALTLPTVQRSTKTLNATIFAENVVPKIKFP